MKTTTIDLSTNNYLPTILGEYNDLSKSIAEMEKRKSALRKEIEATIAKEAIMYAAPESPTMNEAIAVKTNGYAVNWKCSTRTYKPQTIEIKTLSVIQQ